MLEGGDFLVSRDNQAFPSSLLFHSQKNEHHYERCFINVKQKENFSNPSQPSIVKTLYPQSSTPTFPLSVFRLHHYCVSFWESGHARLFSGWRSPIGAPAC